MSSGKLDQNYIYYILKYIDTRRIVDNIGGIRFAFASVIGGYVGLVVIFLILKNMAGKDEQGNMKKNIFTYIYKLLLLFIIVALIGIPTMFFAWFQQEDREFVIEMCKKIIIEGIRPRYHNTLQEFLAATPPTPTPTPTPTPSS